MKILVADDEKDIRCAIEQLLARRGHACVLARDGDEALELFERERPDLVILDVVMPGRNGFEACRAIREADARVPVIMLSAKSDIVDKSVGFSVGCDDYVSKPFNKDELLMRVEAGLRRVCASRADAPAASRGRAVVRIRDLEIHFKRNEVRLRGKARRGDAQGVPDPRLLGEPCRRRVEHARDHRPRVGRRVRSESASIAVFVRKIRNKIEDDPSKPTYLQTVWRQGYRLGNEGESGFREDQ